MTDRSDETVALPVDERPAMVESTSENADAVPVDEKTKAEMGRRLALHRRDPESADDLDAVIARLRAND